MWKQIAELGGKLLFLLKRIQQLEEGLVEVKQAITAVNGKLDRLTDAVDGIISRMEYERENAEKDRQILRLQLENALLRFERGLPIVPPDSEV